MSSEHWSGIDFFILMLTRCRVSTRSIIKLTVIGLSILSGLSACQTGSFSSSANPLSKAAEPLQQEDSDPVAVSETPLLTPTPQEMSESTPQPTEGKAEMITITIVFDTGGSGLTLLENMSEMNINPAEVQNVVLSHKHNDHTAGLQALLSAGADPKIYLLPSFSSSFKNQFSQQAEVIEVVPGLLIEERISTLGEIQGSPPDQALVIDTPRGLVVITGCAHPGVVKIVLAAKRQFKEEIYLEMGGFHLGSSSSYQVKQIIKEFQRIGVVHVAPCLCTGDRAINQFREAFGENFISVGAGAVIEIES